MAQIATQCHSMAGADRPENHPSIFALAECRGQFQEFRGSGWNGVACNIYRAENAGKTPVNRSISVQDQLLRAMSGCLSGASTNGMTKMKNSAER